MFLKAITGEYINSRYISHLYLKDSYIAAKVKMFSEDGKPFFGEILLRGEGPSSNMVDSLERMVVKLNAVSS